jgi:predicted permease
MSNALLIVTPIIAIFALGLLLRQVKLFSQEDADIFIKMAFFVSLPAIILKTIPNVEISLQFLILPIIAIVTIILMFIFTFSSVKIFNFEKKTEGVFIIGPMVLNLGFNVPFVIAAYGEEGFARASFFDIGNLILMLSLIYFLAQRYSSPDTPPKLFNKKLLTSPPLLALIIAIILNISNFTFDPVIIDLLNLLGALLTPLLMIAIGIYFNPTQKNLIPALTAVLIRMGVGLLFGLSIVFLFNLDALSEKIIIISSAAPIGFNTLTFATLEDLDKEFAANIVSIAIPIGIVLITVLLLLLG